MGSGGLSNSQYPKCGKWAAWPKGWWVAQVQYAQWHMLPSMRAWGVAWEACVAETGWGGVCCNQWGGWRGGEKKERKKERTAPICTHLTEGHNPLLLETDRESTERKRGRGGKNRRHNDKETERKGKTGVRYRREACTKVVKRKPRPPLLRSHWQDTSTGEGEKFGLFQNQQTDTKVLTQCLGGGGRGKCATRKKGFFEVRLCQSCTGSVVEVQVGKMQLVLASWVWYSTDGGSESESGDVSMRLMCLI